MQTFVLLFTIFVSVIFTLTYAQDSAELKVKGQEFLLEVSQRENIHKMKSGLLVEILATSEKEDAKSPNVDDSCEVTYSGTFMDGKPFEPPTKDSFAPNEVIKGWAEALQLMSEGDKWKLYVPYDLAYGEEGFPTLDPPIPAFSPLVFELEIHSVNGTGKSLSEAKAMFNAALADVSVEL